MQRYAQMDAEGLVRVALCATSYCCAGALQTQVYTIYSILFIVFIILIIVTAFITVALTYFQLAVEDHRWWWRSVQCGGSTGATSVPPSILVTQLGTRIEAQKTAL